MDEDEAWRYLQIRFASFFQATAWNEIPIKISLIDSDEPNRL